MRVSVVIPAYEEALRVADAVRGALDFADEVLVVDDGSTDGTSEVAAAAGARVIRRPHSGYVESVKQGFREASGDVVVTMDADGEHRAADIPRLVSPIEGGTADLVLGQRAEIPRISERVLSWLARRRVPVRDSGTGFRAMRRSLATRMQLQGRCICGTSVLEAAALGARILEVPIQTPLVDTPRGVAWYHLVQLWYVLGWLLLGRIKPGRGDRRPQVGSQSDGHKVMPLGHDQVQQRACFSAGDYRVAPNASVLSNEPGGCQGPRLPGHHGCYREGFECGFS